MAVRRALLWLVVIALVTAQALGLMHRVIHGPQSAAAHESVAQSMHGGSPGVTHGAGWVSELFSAHSDDSTCRLFDPLNHEAAPVVPAVVLPLVLASSFVAFFLGESLARWAALYDARGPPSLR